MKKIKLIIGIALLTLSIHSVWSQTDPVDKNGIANGGYDLVSYFSNNKAMKGNEKYSVDIKYLTRFFVYFLRHKTFYPKLRVYSYMRNQ